MQIIKRDHVERNLEAQLVETAAEGPEADEALASEPPVEPSGEPPIEASDEPAIESPVGAQPVEPAAEPTAEAEPSDQPPLVEEPVPLSDAAVTAHTASLWKYLPLPAGEPENSPQYGTEYQEFEGGRLIAARVRGKKHKHEGTNCDDWMEVAHCGDLGDIAILLVSDGAGSKHYSRLGSRESCQAALSFLKRGVIELEAQTDFLKFKLAQDFSSAEFSEVCGKLVQLVQQSVLAGRKAVEAAFEARKQDEGYMKPLGRELVLSDFAATLLVTLVIPVPRLQEQLIVSCQVGDGMIAALDTRGKFGTALRLLADGDSGEFSGETDFLTSSKMTELAELQRRTKISRCRADLVMAMTDGVADDYDPNKPELYGLYFDLLANNVLRDDSCSIAGLTPEESELLRSTPAPVSYPWVNNPQVQVALQYEERLLDAFGMTLEEMWQKQEILRYASVGVTIQPKERPEQKLKQWLDNYTRRGSFDDRTLALLQLRRPL